MLLEILKGRPHCGRRTRSFGAETEPQNCAEGFFFFPEGKAAAVSDSEDGLVVVKILSVLIIFMKNCMF